ncbi:hypothetical protein MTR_3g097050 [Medicago truncatula]|uniref:Uncharacterized protein n=1 Tax=Medicago truncatula TaxID=3880 RepID=G7J2N2_MEDTR|nr:hypothetical protein MTR_3g097050 [Medicago truncatula]
MEAEHREMTPELQELLDHIDFAVFLLCALFSRIVVRDEEIGVEDEEEKTEVGDEEEEEEEENFKFQIFIFTFF